MHEHDIVNERGWIQTATGRIIDPLNPEVEQIDIRDIAHALGNICRFSGQSSIFYSVAQHSIIVAELVGLVTEDDPVPVMFGLLHDAAEAYLGDVSTPMKTRSAFITGRKIVDVEAVGTRRDISFGAVFERFATAEHRLLDVIIEAVVPELLSRWNEETARALKIEERIKTADLLALKGEVIELMGGVNTAKDWGLSGLRFPEEYDRERFRLLSSPRSSHRAGNWFFEKFNRLRQAVSQ